MIRVLSLGAGVQSSTVLLMSCKGILPKLDAAIFADTQWEPPAVYKWLDFLKIEAKGYGIPIHIVTRGNLRKDAIEFRATGGKGSGLTNKRYASMPLFIKNPDGTKGIVNRQCTSEYKIQPIVRCVREVLLGLKRGERAPKNSVEQWFGISADEPQRQRDPDNKWQVFRYPLIYDVKMNRGFHGSGYTRKDCLDWLENNDYPKPPRSACIGCPFHSDEEWYDMKKNRPDDWIDAVEFDRTIREVNSKVAKTKGKPFLHPSCVPLDQVTFKLTTRLIILGQGFGNECRGMCGV